MASQPNLIEINPAFLRWSFLDGLRAARVPSGWAPVLARDPMLRRVAMVFDLVLGGQTVRISSAPIRSVSSRTGVRHDAVPAILEEPSLAAVYTLGSGQSAARQLDLTIDVGPISPMAIIRAGGMLVGLAEVSLEPTDTENDYEDRLVLLRGDVGSIVFGAIRSPRAGGRTPDRETATLQIVDPRDSMVAILPPWTVSSDRFSGLPDQAIGTSIPLVLNSGKATPTIRLTTATTGSNSFLVGLGDLDVVAAANEVYINGVSAFGGADAWVAETLEDEQGLTYTQIRFTNGARAWDDSDAVHVNSSALDELDREHPVDVIRRVVERYSPIGRQGVNPSLFAAAAARYPSGLGAPRVLINASGSSSGSVLDWIESGFLASYPMISMVWSRGGYGPILTDSRAEPIARFTVGAFPIFDRVSMVTESPKRELVNRVQIRFSYNPMRDTFAGVVTRSPSNSSICETSRMLVGPREAQPIDSVFIADRDTAEYVADWIVQHRALPSYLVEYDASPQAFLMYERGDTVALTDDEFGWVDERATIEAIVYARAKCSITLRVWLRYLDVGSAASSRPSTR